jgi:Zn-dependent metalloprotease
VRHIVSNERQVARVHLDTVGAKDSMFRLREAGRGNGIETYVTSVNAVDFIDTDNNWNNVNANLDEAATDAHWGCEMTYDYFFLEHNRNSLDDAGLALIRYVHYDNLYANAFWDGQRMTYGDGNGTNPARLLLVIIIDYRLLAQQYCG